MHFRLSEVLQESQELLGAVAIVTQPLFGALLPPQQTQKVLY